MPLLLDSTYIWTGAATLIFLVVGSYATVFERRNRRDQERLREAVRLGIDRPVAQAPVIDPVLCIGCGGCVTACPEGDVLGIVGGTAVVVNGLRCVGHAKCEDECPVGALKVETGDLSLREDVPLLDHNGETNVEDVYVVGELSGVALIRHAIDQGARSVRALAEKGVMMSNADVDVAIIGAGPSGISAALASVEKGLSCRVFEQAESLGGTILHYPQRKLVLTQPVDMPMGHRMKREEYTREELLEFFGDVVAQHDLDIAFDSRVLDTVLKDGVFVVKTADTETRARSLVIAVGRRGTPRKLGVRGEELSKVRYQLRDAASYRRRRILVVGGGDSAVEAAIQLGRSGENQVMLSYRRDSFVRIKRKNQKALEKEITAGRVKPLLGSEVQRIDLASVILSVDGGEVHLPNDDVFIMIGSEPSLPLLKRLGVRFGGEDAVLIN